MKKGTVVLCAALLMSGAAWAQDSGGEGGDSGSGYETPNHKNALNVGLGYMIPYLKGADVKGRLGFNVGYEFLGLNPISIGTAIDAGVRSIDCAGCTDGKGTESFVEVSLLSNYRFPFGLYVGPRLGFAFISYDLPTAFGSLQANSESEFSLGAQAGFSVPIYSYMKLGAEVSYAYIFTDAKASITNILATFTYLF